MRTAHSGEEALQIAVAFEPQVVFLDLGLPGISGYDVARRLRERQAAGQCLEIIAVSGYGQPEDQALDNGRLRQSPGQARQDRGAGRDRCAHRQQ
ncbi:hypothetical protein BN2476_300009 [Paraburkholderia piptadeniae]|uniref:Response regulatory domain-containing protein n=1 Tax=Paraburkholderia piptadeniae TaxID=1701573 RepID=A0A1N7S2D2_9BURK|nr:hypothetical protein BN2476_300009 [Paraburkholderia piptadeniae]